MTFTLDESVDELYPKCEKCGINEAQPDTNPPMCAQCMADKGGGNDPETLKQEGRDEV